MEKIDSIRTPFSKFRDRVLSGDATITKLLGEKLHRSTYIPIAAILAERMVPLKNATIMSHIHAFIEK